VLWQFVLRVENLRARPPFCFILDTKYKIRYTVYMPKLSPRVVRRAVILMVFLAVFFLFGYGTKKLTETPPSCTDGIKNGEEEGVDCGLFACNNYCEPDLAAPTIVQTKLIEAGKGDYDFVAEILNPHPNFGASEVSYDLIFQNDAGEEVLSRSGVFYILPGQTKFLILPSLTTENNVKSIEFKVLTAKWQRADFLEGMNFTTKNVKYVKSSDGVSSYLEGIISNNSDIDFNLVDIDVILYNSRGQIIGVNKTDVRTLSSGSERYFMVKWPFALGDNVAKYVVNISTNLFLDLNYIKRYGSTPERFQEYKKK